MTPDTSVPDDQSSLLQKIGPGRKPDVVCIGAQKAGTSWLNEVLGGHPQIWTPPFKELHFFDHKFIPECRQWAPWHVRKSIRGVFATAEKRGRVISDDERAYLDAITAKPMFNGTWYKRIFAPAPPDALCLDVTPEYSTLPEEGVEFAARFLGPAKIIYIIRDPLGRALSQLRMNVSRRKQPPASISEWIEEAQKPILQQRGDYKSYVPRWKNALPADQLMFIPYGRLRADPDGLMKDIEAFLGLEHHKSRRLKEAIHVTPKLTVPDECLPHLRAFTEEQDAFLHDAFGPEFAGCI